MEKLGSVLVTEPTLAVVFSRNADFESRSILKFKSKKIFRPWKNNIICAAKCRISNYFGLRERILQSTHRITTGMRFLGEEI